jgi:hypothetical protein
MPKYLEWSPIADDSIVPTERLLASASEMPARPQSTCKPHKKSISMTAEALVHNDAPRTLAAAKPAQHENLAQWPQLDDEHLRVELCFKDRWHLVFTVYTINHIKS